MSTYPVVVSLIVRDLLDSKTRTTTRTRLFNTKVVHARQLASFRRENAIAVVILLRVLAKMSQWRKQVIEKFEVLSFCDQKRA